MHPIIIIGSGLAGYNTAREIRQHNAQIPLLMITQDGGAFYSKPQLSMALAQVKTAESLMTMTAEIMQEKLNMPILTYQSVNRIDHEQKKIYLDDKAFDYSSLVLALGADSPIPPFAGDARNDIFSINDVYQYQQFRNKLRPDSHVTLIGAGLVGCEFANDLTQSGHRVVCIDQAATALPLLIPPTIAEQLQSALHAEGVDWYLGHMVEAINHHGHHLRVSLENEMHIDTDLVISATGLRPRTALAKTNGIHTNKGIVVDTYLETNIPDIYALGDCAEINGWTLPYIAPLMQAAKALGKTLTGEKTAVHFPAMPVSVKTSVYPITKCCAPTIAAQDWTFDLSDQGIRAYLKNADNQLLGFILTKDAVKDRATLLASMDQWL